MVADGFFIWERRLHDRFARAGATLDILRSRRTANLDYFRDRAITARYGTRRSLRTRVRKVVQREEFCGRLR